MSRLDIFNGDYGELSRLMRVSWAANKQEPLIYTEPFLRSAFAQPGASLGLSAAIYRDGSLVGAYAAFPRHTSANQARWKLAISTFLTVHPQFRQQGFGAALWREMLDRVREQGGDGMITNCVQGDAMDQILPAIAARCRADTRRIFTVHYLARLVPKGRGPLSKADPEILLRSALPPAPGLALARLWSEEEALWQCRYRNEAFGCSYKDGDREGTITAYAMPAGRAASITCGLVDDVLWREVDQEGRLLMVQRLLDSASAAGIELLLVPVMHYTDLEAFRKSGFRATRRALNSYLSSWDDNLRLAEGAGIYLDVF